MAASRFTFSSFLLRWIFALLLVSLSWNPTGYAWLQWVLADLRQFDAVKALCGVLLLAGWTIYLRATLRSLGVIGLALVSALIATLVWLLVDLGWIQRDSVQALAWIAVVATATLMAVGLSWSHIRRRLSGQVDMDDVDE